jgi:Aldehyde dehydrogenase family
LDTSQETVWKTWETSRSDADQRLTRLDQHRSAWLTVSSSERLHLINLCLQSILSVAESWVEAACAAKALDPDSGIAGEEWITGPFAVMRYLQRLKGSLAALETSIPAQVAPAIRSLKKEALEDRQTQAKIQPFPQTLFDRLLYRGITAQVWGLPGHPLGQGLPAVQDPAGSVALVLGAGNITSIGPLDVLHQLFIENRVALLKMNPVNAVVGPWLEKAFAPLQTRGLFEVVYGGADLGAYLCQHPSVGAVHITGAQQTHDVIVWGREPERTQRKAAGNPVLQKPITSELGGVTPILVVPGQWSERDLAFQARHVASMVTHNASFNCVAAQVLILSQAWPQRAQFLDLLRQQLRQIPPRQAYYPGAQERYQQFLDRYPQAEVLGQTAEGCIPWTLIPQVPSLPDEYALTTEAFCGLIAEVSLEAPNRVSIDPAKDFLERVVPFVNDGLYGTLSCTLLIDPKTQSRLQTELEAALTQLRYGTIGINIWSGALFVMPDIPWGAFPGSTLDKIGSGQGFVHNTCLALNPQKAVVSAPFYIWPTPVWFAQHRTLSQLGRRLVAFEHRPNWLTLSGVALAALRG